MNLRQKIISEYQMTVLAANVNSELKRSLKYNERVPKFIENLEVEIKNMRVTLKEEQIRYAVKSLTELFLRLMEDTANKRMMSDIEKHRRIAEAAEAMEREKIGSAIAQGKQVEFDGDKFKVREDGEAQTRD